MKADHGARRSFESPWDAVPLVASTEAEDTRSDATRSARNIALWRTYLPEDCVKVMIAMRWDITT
jgi:hypothetical protein